MKIVLKKVFIFIPVLLASLCLLACSKETEITFGDVVNNIYQSEQIIAGYNEKNVINDGDFVVYSKETKFILQRKDIVRSDVEIVEKKLSTSGQTQYDETITSYKTIDNIKYTEVNGKVYENEFTMPTYYLTFVLSEEFFESYDLRVDGNKCVLTGKILDNKVSSLFINKSVKTISGLNVEIIVEDSLLKSFSANYISTNGFNVEIETEYLYGSVGQGKAVFYLEGGSCQNSKDRISYLYTFDGSKYDMLIADPNVIETDEKDHVMKNGYYIEGWYQNKTIKDDGTIEYSNKWDFSKDKMTIDGVTLYAKWEKNKVYSYEVYYFDEDLQKEVLLDSYVTSEGAPFSEYLLEKTEVKGYTSIGYYDEYGDKWDEDFKHPGGDEDLAVKVYLKLIKGKYTIVGTSKQFNAAIKSNDNIYLLNDIDFKGTAINYGTYSGIIEGNGHKLYNFKINYSLNVKDLQGELDDLDGVKNHLYVSLFFELKNATIKDLSFEDFTASIDTTLNQIQYIIIAPLAIVASSTKLENVNVNGSLIIITTPDNCEIVEIYDDFWYRASDDANEKIESEVKFTKDSASN